MVHLIKKILLCLALMAIAPQYSHAQSGRWFVELSSGFGSGWWAYNRGSTSPESADLIGLDRTPHSPYAHFGATVSLRLQRFYFGAAIHRDYFLEDKMWAFEDADNFRNRFAIADGNLPLRKKMLVLAVDMIRKSAFVMQPEIRFGSFSMETLHPDRDNFAEQRVWQIGIGNMMTSGRWALIVRPFYTVYAIRLKVQPNANASHRIYHAGVIIALRANFL